MQDSVIINDKEYKFKTSAALPILYQQYTDDHRDLLKDFQKISGKKKDVFDSGAVGILTDLAYCMAKLADKETPNKLEWLDGFDVMELYQIILPKVVELWAQETKTTSTPKK